MIILRSILAVAIVTIATPVAAQQPSSDRLGNQVAPFGATDPLRVIYRVSGVRDDGDASQSGIATSFHCSSNSLVTETIKFRVFDPTGTVAGEFALPIGKGQTITASTHDTRVFSEHAYLTGERALSQGMGTIFATSPNIICSAMVVDASSSIPVGVSLHMVRFDARPGTQE